MIMFALSVFWLACAIVGYLILRHAHRQPPSTWTQFDRLECIGWGILYGPLLLVVFLVVVVYFAVKDSRWAQREAKW